LHDAQAGVAGAIRGHRRALEKAVKDATHHQIGATSAFAIGEKQFDELLRLIIAKNR